MWVVVVFVTVIVALGFIRISCAAGRDVCARVFTHIAFAGVAVSCNGLG